MKDEEMVATAQRMFKEFPPVSTEQWEEIIQRDLKGADYDRKLIWKTYEGIRVRPYYRREDLSSLPYLQNNCPGEFPFARGNDAAGRTWAIRQDCFIADIVAANRAARKALETGATDIGFVTSLQGMQVKGQPVQTQDDMAALLEGIYLHLAPVHFDWGRYSPLALALLDNVVDRTEVDRSVIRGSLMFDPLAETLVPGATVGSPEEAIGAAIRVVQFTREQLPLFRPLMIGGYTYQEAGGSVVQELAFALAGAVAYLHAWTEAGEPLTELLPRMGFGFAMGSNYFFEIAKLRAARLLWASILKAYGVDDAAAQRMFIHARTALLNKTIFDPNVNMLRNTMEAMSAVLGGCDMLTVLPHDLAFRQPTETSSRIARNVQLILQHETYFPAIVDPAGGSYYLETLTDAIAAEAWGLFQRVEDEGGFLPAVQKGFVQEEIARVREQRAKNIGSRRETILGTNQFPNLDEQMAEEFVPAVTVPLTTASDSVSLPAQLNLGDITALKESFEAGGHVKDVVDRLPATGRGKGFRVLPVFRGAEIFESIRLDTEAYQQRTGKCPTVFLWTTGNVTMRRARAAFMANFFGCAGFAVVDNNGFSDLEEAMQAVRKSQPDCVVLCSSDQEYADLAPEACAALQKEFPQAERIVAGYPKDMIEQLQRAGVQNFIHIKTNAVECLRAYQKKLGVIA